MAAETQEDLGLRQQSPGKDEVGERVRAANTYGILRGRVLERGLQLTAFAEGLRELGLDARFLSQKAMVTIGEAALLVDRAAKLLAQAQLEVNPQKKP